MNKAHYYQSLNHRCIFAKCLSKRIFTNICITFFCHYCFGFASPQIPSMEEVPFSLKIIISLSPPPTSLVETPFKDFDQLNSHNHLQTAGGNLHSKGFQEVFRIISPGLKNMENSSYFHHMVKMHNSSFELMVVLQCSLSSLD